MPPTLKRRPTPQANSFGNSQPKLVTFFFNYKRTQFVSFKHIIFLGRKKKKRRPASQLPVTLSFNMDSYPNPSMALCIADLIRTIMQAVIEREAASQQQNPLREDPPLAPIPLTKSNSKKDLLKRPFSRRNWSFRSTARNSARYTRLSSS